MNYFVNENIFTLNSGTEFSAVERVNLFKQHGKPAKILTRNYNPQLWGDLDRVGLTHADVVNMYDYFQGTLDVEKKDLDVRYAEVIDKYEYHIEGIDANESLIKHEGKTIARVQIAPATVGLIGAIEWFNDNMVVLARDQYDRRGFKSSTQYFHPTGANGAQVFYNLDGKPVLEINHMNINGQLAPTMYKLLDYKGKAYRFNNEQELFQFFLNELAAQEPVSLICDRPSLAYAVANTQNAVGKWIYLHNTHNKNNQQAGASRQVADYLEPIFKDLATQFDGVLTATEQQAEEIAKFANFKQVLAVPDSFVEHADLPDFDSRDLAKLIYVGRIADDKGAMVALDILSRVRQVMPNVTLDFYGYASPAEVQQRMDELVKSNGLEAFVNFRGYQGREEVKKALRQAAVLINTAPGEGFGMNILEGMAQGTPAVTFNVKYGPSVMIEDGKNGRLINVNNGAAFASAVVELLKNPAQLKAMGEAAHERAHDWTADKAFGGWASAREIANNLYVEG